MKQAGRHRQKRFIIKPAVTINAKRVGLPKWMVVVSWFCRAGIWGINGEEMWENFYIINNEYLQKERGRVSVHTACRIDPSTKSGFCFRSYLCEMDECNLSQGETHKIYTSLSCNFLSKNIHTRILWNLNFFPCSLGQIYGSTRGRLYLRYYISCLNVQLSM